MAGSTEKPPDDDPDELSLPEAAREWGVVRQVAYVWAITGRLKCRKVAGRYVVRRGEVERVKKAREGGTWRLAA